MLIPNTSDTILLRSADPGGSAYLANIGTVSHFYNFLVPTLSAMRKVLPFRMSFNLLAYSGSVA